MDAASERRIVPDDARPGRDQGEVGCAAAGGEAVHIAPPFRSPADGDQGRLGSTIIFDAREQPGMGGPSPYRLRPSGVFRAFPTAMRAAKRKNPRGAFSGPRADEFHDGVLKGRARVRTACNNKVLNWEAGFASVDCARSCQRLDNLEVATVRTVGDLQRLRR